MARFLTYMYLAVTVYCLVNAFMSVQAHHYQYTWLSLILAGINFIFFTIFRKQPQPARRPKLKLLQGVKQKI